jgi:pilus assembly protein FimV
MRSYLPRLVLTGALLSPATLFALGLGEIRLNSALNQPFDADIELIAPTADELASLKVGLANNDLFSRYGLERPAYLSNFDFSVSRARDGRATIKVSSNRSVTEPFVTLLVEANWGRGRILREYTVLLDPPVFMPSQPENQAPVTSPQSGTRNEGRIEREPTPAPAPAPVPSPSEPARPAPAPAEPEATRETPISSTAPAALGGSYTVERNDTLWRIASRAQPGASPRVVNQTMIALFRANPEAFDGNINRLKAGSVLRVPEQGDIESISTSEASAEVNRQQQEWSGAPRTAAGDEPSRLRLVPPEETPTAPAPAAPVEAPTAATRPGSTSPSATPEDRRLEVTSPELANAQQRATEAPITPEPEATASTPAPEAEQPTAETPVPEAETPAAAPPVAQPQRPRAAPAQPQADEPSLLDRLKAFWWLPVLLGLLVVGVLAFLKRRRDQADLNDLPDASDAFTFEPRATRSAATVSRDDDFDVADDADHDETQNFDVAPVTRTKTRPVDVEPEFAASSTADDTLSSETSVRFDQQDALAEADFHMAYGLYDQAADLVKIAIDREPARRDLKLKLLEIYFVWGNKDLFLDTARDLNANREEGPAGEWDKVLIMGKQIAPDDPMFKGEAGGHVDLVDVNLEGGENRVDVDLFAEPGSDGSGAREGLDLQFASGEHQGLSASNNSNLDFLLDDEKAPRGDDEPTREMDHLARTQETPTIESPAIDRTSTTLREKVDRAAMARGVNPENTAELSLDDLGLDVDSLEATGSLEDTTSLMKDSGETEISPLRDDEMTQLAPSLGSLDRTMEAPRRVETFDIESTGTIYVDQVDLAGGDTVEQRRPDVDSTASFARPHEIDVDFDNLDAPSDESNQTIRQSTRGEGDASRFSDDVFTTDSTASMQRIDLDVGEPLGADDREPTNKVATTEMELSELEPVTMSEVGTKLDLARAYMDMGDPDGARSILEEVVAEGSSSQKQEAQRLLDSIR